MMRRLPGGNVCLFLKRMCFYCIEVIAFRVNHFVGGIVFHKHRVLVTHYVGLSPVRKSNQVKSVFHTMLYIKQSTVHI